MHSDPKPQEERGRSPVVVGNALAVIEAEFGRLLRGTPPLAVDGAEVERGLPARKIRLDELRDLLLADGASGDLRDAVWSLLVTRSRTDPAWVVACLGMALPGLKAIAARLTSGFLPTVGEEVIAEMVAVFVIELARIDLSKPNICSRLVGWARKKGSRERARHLNAAAVLPLEPIEAAAPDHVSDADPAELLLKAATLGIISTDAAELIEITRLDKVSLADYARKVGQPEDRLRKRRKTAEQRLADAIHTGDLSI